MPPITPPKVIRALPLLIVNPRAPLIVELDPLNRIAASVALKEIAPVERLTGPV